MEYGIPFLPKAALRFALGCRGAPLRGWLDTWAFWMMIF